jgi:Carboxypeptidase regulatory-like domain
MEREGAKRTAIRKGVNKQMNWIGSSASLSRQPEATLKPHAWNRRTIPVLFCLLIFSLLLLPSSTLAQEYRATISGRVIDPTGAAVPGASIEVLETGTGAISRTVSDSVGAYVVPFLLPGNYSITVTKAGFKTLVRSGITLQTQEHPIMNLELALGGENQTVTVTSQAPLLSQNNASVGTVVSTSSVEDEPLNGRTPAMLALLAPGVTPYIASSFRLVPYSAQNLNQYMMGGTLIDESESLLDGAPNLFLSGGLMYSPPQDGVQEVSAQPFDTDASYGHTDGGVVNVITKSGTNSLHGSAYEFGAISDLFANLYFNDRNTPVTPKPVSHFNQYGLSAGGPVLIPKVFNGRNKLFFFFSWEGVREASPVGGVVTVPTDAEKEGDFSALLAGGTSYQLYEPNTGTLTNGKYTRTPVPNNCLTNQSSYCSSVANAGITINPITANYLKLYPEPNYTSGVSPITNEDNYISTALATQGYSNEFGRLDYNVGARDHVFFDFRHNQLDQTGNDTLGNNTAGLLLLRHNWGSTLDNVFTINPTTILDTRLSWSWFNEFYESPNAIYTPDSLGFPSSMQSAATYVMMPTIEFSYSNASFFNFVPETTPNHDPSTDYQVYSDIIKSAGRHTLKLGFDGREYRQRISSYGTNSEGLNDASGQFDFTSDSFVTSGTSGSAQPFGGDLAEFEYGLPPSGSFGIYPEGDYRSYYIASFVQDDWRVNSHLTLNLGVRYEVNTPLSEKFGRTVSGWNPTAVNSASTAATTAFTPTAVSVNDTTVSVNSINTLGGLTFPSPSWGAPYKIADAHGFWSPRVGFSYSPARFNKTVLHAGFGMYAGPQNLGIGNSQSASYQEGFSSETSYAATSDSYFQSESTLSNPFPNGFTQPTGSSLGTSTYLGAPASINFYDPVEHDQYSERWSLDVQHALTSSTLLDVIYMGNHALHLAMSKNINALELQYMTTNPYRDSNLSTAVGTAVTNPFKGLLPNNSSYNGATTSLGNLLYPYPAYGNSAITEEQITGGQSYYNSGILHIEQRTKHGLTLLGNFTFSKWIDADSFLNAEDAQPTRMISTYDHKYVAHVGGDYELPFGRGKLFSLGGSKLMDEIAGGWVLNGLYQFESGAPIDFTGDIPLQPGMTIKDLHSNPRDTSPAGSGKPALANASNVFVTGSGTSCTASAGQPCDGTVFFNGQYVDHYRTLPLTMGWVRQDGFNNLDASLLKNFKFTETTSLQLRLETFNTLNHPSFGTPNITPTSSAFGYITSVYTNSQPRQVQLAARFVF